VLKAKNLTTSTYAAVKFENNSSSTLAKEHKIMEKMAKFKGFPQVYGYVRQGTQQYLVMELLGESLLHFFERKGRRPLPMKMLLTAFGQ
jgi:predicted Ser/Thr protein kinase